jgi:MFS family permease
LPGFSLTAAVWLLTLLSLEIKTSHPWKIMNNGTAPNAQRLLWAGFFAIFAEGVGFGVRGAILADWAHEFGFTQVELGAISGGGLWGFGLIIVAGCLLADRIGYGRLMVFTFIMHLLSAALLLSTGAIYENLGGSGAVKISLTVAMIIFSIANGTLEVVVNPMVAVLFPKEQTHYLNILHAGWPGGLMLGGLIGWFFHDIVPINWVIQMSLFLVPVAIYGLMMLGQHFPRSEASQAGISFGTMIAQFAAPMLLLLLVIHALVGYVELGTDSWITKVTGSIMASPGAGMLLFVYTSLLMFTLRFFGGPIEHMISPLGLLFSCAVIASIGLTLLGNAQGVLMCVVAATVYGVGKTFFWPTMLAVVSEQFPKGGAVTIGAIGGAGMLSAGLLGAPGIGFQQDHYRSAELKKEAPATYERYAAGHPNTFLGFETKGLDGSKVGLVVLEDKIIGLKDELKKLDSASATAEREKKQKALKLAEEELDTTLKRFRESKQPEHTALVSWWESAKEHARDDAKPIESAELYGGRMALKWTALVPATMAVLYLLLVLYFRFKGGYTKVGIDQAMEKALEAPGSAGA